MDFKVIQNRLELCRRIGASYLILHMGRWLHRLQGLQVISKIVSEVADNYEHAGIILLLENHYSYFYKGLHELGGDPEDMIIFFEKVNSPAVRFCLDYGHANMAGKPDGFY